MNSFKYLLSIIFISIFFNSCQDVKSEGEIEIAIKNHIITKKQALRLSHNYDKRAALINQLIGKKDARSVWFSIETLESYIAYAKLKNKNVNGMRLYFGAYGSEMDSKKEYSTLFIVPTTAKAQISNGFLPMSTPSEDTEIPPLN